MRTARSDYDTRLLTVAALNGAFQGRVDQTVNYVDAPVIAAERGIEVSEERSPHVTRLHEPRRGPDDGRRGGRRRGDDDRPRAPALPASALGFAIDVELAPHMVFFRYDDVPG